MSVSKGLLFLTTGLAVLAAGGCAPSDDAEVEEVEPTPQASAVAEADTTGAAIWAHLQERERPHVVRAQPRARRRWRHESTVTPPRPVAAAYASEDPHG